jgi:hypothetical protein
MRSNLFVLSAALAWQLGGGAYCLQGQDSKQMELILQRLARLEAQNEALRQEVAALRGQLNPASVPLSETVEVQRNQIQEQAQTKVESSSKQPLTIHGTMLMNAFWNGAHNNGAINSPTASLLAGPRSAGITFSQTIIGISFRNPNSILGAALGGSLLLDFFDANARTGNPPRQQGRHLFDYPRIRTANIELDWRNTTLSFGQEKPLISPHDPTTLAQRGIAPLTGAGNLWLWQPQVRLEQRFRLSDSMHIKAQGSIYQTAEDSANLPAVFVDSLATVRPGLQGRLAVVKKAEGETVLELGTGFHASSTRVAGSSAPSRLFTLDWQWRALEKLELTGTFFNGKNLAHMGTNRQGFTILSPGNVRPVRSTGGWVQFAYQITPRLSSNFYSGQHDDRNADLNRGQIGKNFVYAANLIYKVATNVSISFEASQARTDYIGIGRRLKNHYDLALAYQF